MGGQKIIAFDLGFVQRRRVVATVTRRRKTEECRTARRQHQHQMCHLTLTAGADDWGHLHDLQLLMLDLQFGFISLKKTQQLIIYIKLSVDRHKLNSKTFHSCFPDVENLSACLHLSVRCRHHSRVDFCRICCLLLCYFCADGIWLGVTVWYLHLYDDAVLLLFCSDCCWMWCVSHDCISLCTYRKYKHVKATLCFIYLKIIVSQFFFMIRWLVMSRVAPVPSTQPARLAWYWTT